MSQHSLGLHAAGLLGLLAVALAALCVGQPMLWPTHILDGDMALLIGHVRLPRLLAGVVVGAALGTSGLLLQTLARNRLASPDVMGLNDGAMLALAAGLLLSSTGSIGPWWHALLGVLLTVCVVVFAAGGVGTQGYRVLVVGLGMGSLIKAAFDLSLSTLPIMHASSLYALSVGSLGGRGLSLVLTAAVAIAAPLATAVVLSRPLALLALHDDCIRSLGVRLPGLRMVVLLLAATLAGVAVSLAGPVGFVALAAPILATRAQGDARPPVLLSALTGAVMVIGADVLGRVLAPPSEVPAGVVTGLLGGPFLLWMLLRRGPGA